MGHRQKLIRDSAHLVQEEQNKLVNWRRVRGRENQPWTGIALSGGGIRSATFCLGVLQALANKGHFKHFDYISTVSGGGYIGCALQWWWHQPPISKKPNKRSSHPKVESELGTGRSDFPFGTSEPGPAPSKGDNDQRARLKRLRDHANYLAPGGGINYWSGVGAVLRAILLNLLVWIPLIGLLFFIIAILDEVLKPLSSPANHILSFVPETAPVLFVIILIIVAFAIGLFVLACTLYSLVSTHEEGKVVEYAVGYMLSGWVLLICFFIVHLYFKNLDILRDPYLSSTFVIVILLALVLFWKAISKTIPAWLFPEGIGEAYEYRRVMDYAFGRFFPVVIILGAFSLLPFVYQYISSSSPKASVVSSLLPKAAIPDFVVGMFAVGTGTVASLWGYYQLFHNYAPKLATRVFLPVGGALFLVGIAVLGYHFGVTIYREVYKGIGDPVEIIGIVRSPSLLFKFMILILVVCALLFAFMVNINQISLNRFYRDRLMEAFMPSKASSSDRRGASPADTLSLSDLWPGNGIASAEETWAPPGPYPLINTNVVLVNDGDPKFRLRGGDNFVLAPYFCGSEATGWSYTKEAFPHLSLASCMAASAAAVNPFSGYVGTGPTRNRIVSIVLALLNLRLGFWVRNPAKPGPQAFPNHIVPGLSYAIFTQGHRHNNKFLELTDGGHFDNLGLYELVRRKCKAILICDGELDKTTSYAALVSVQRRIKDDFDAHISFDPHQGPELLVENTSMDYPSDAFMAKQTFFVARIVYKDGSDGKIIYIKARMIKELSFEVKAYKGAHMDFPHETTGNQFFQPEQFDAHLELGYRAGTCADDSIKSVLAQATVSTNDVGGANYH